MWIDIGDLIRRQVPDKNGKVLPVDLTSGSYQFNELTNHGIGSLFEGKVIYDKTYGHVSYGCASCCAEQPPVQFLPDPFAVGLGASDTPDVEATDGCSGAPDDIIDDFTQWRSSNTSVATINATSALVTGVGVGTATQSSPGEYLYGGIDIKHCTMRPATPSGPANVTSVAISGPSTMALTGQISLTATGSPTGGTYSWSASNSTLALTNTSSATVNVAAASAGSSVLTVTYTQDEAKVTASQAITVQACPTTLTIQSTPTLPLAPLVAQTPPVLSGFGIVAEMQVGPSTVDWNFTPITESVVPLTNTCPSSVAATCSGNDTFTVGSADNDDTYDTVPTPPVQNLFYDNHTQTSLTNLLVAAGITGCATACSQTYTCGGKPLGPTFTITRTYSKGTVGSTAVTNINTTKAPQ